MAKQKGDAATADMFETKYPVRVPKLLPVGDFDTRLRQAVSEALYEARMLRAKKRSVVAAEMGEWLGNTRFSEFMLNQYSSEANESHNINAKTLYALALATGCNWIFDVIFLEPLGCTMLCGDDARTAEIAHLDRLMETMTQRRKALVASSPTKVPRRS